LPGSVAVILAEHVLEHLQPNDCLAALVNCYVFLKDGGLLRLAVPDGYRPDMRYRVAVAPPADGHAVLFTIDEIAETLKRVGYEVHPLEYYDKQGTFHSSFPDPDAGIVDRSSWYDHREQFRYGDVCYTSLIVDARKPCRRQ